MAIKRCIITPELVDAISKKIKQPIGYEVQLTDIISHGAGIVVNYIVLSQQGVECRCTGFLPDPKAGNGLRPRFDMIV